MFVVTQIFCISFVYKKIFQTFKHNLNAEIISKRQYCCFSETILDEPRVSIFATSTLFV